MASHYVHSLVVCDTTILLHILYNSIPKSNLWEMCKDCAGDAREMCGQGAGFKQAGLRSCGCPAKGSNQPHHRMGVQRIWVLCMALKLDTIRNSDTEQMGFFFWFFFGIWPRSRSLLSARQLETATASHDSSSF
jgi:hypothetical protein